MKKELAVGDKARIKQFKKRPYHWCHRMDHLMGQLVEITEVYNNSNDVKINGYAWYFEPSDFEEIVSNCNEPELNVIL